ncbi:MAG: biotin-independent malonate decarboxylase subunit gamma [Pseudomonadota bacterium]|nr:biotin-independent malonate decarboxylase subunit gamma [Pseudomonadota bacterium]
MNTIVEPSRGQVWLAALAGPAQSAGGSKSVLSADAELAGDMVRFIAVVPDPDNHFPRARHGEVGLEQGWALAQLVRDSIGLTTVSGKPRPIVALVDVIGQAYGRREELMGIHIACAAAANAYADARMAGHPVIALIVGQAMSGAFLAHGYQANRLLALDAPGVLIHAMGQAAAARITRRTVAELAELGKRIAPMSYAVEDYAKLGLLETLIKEVDADAPQDADVDKVRLALIDALMTIAARGVRDLSPRWTSQQAVTTRTASIEVRRRLQEQWTC